MKRYSAVLYLPQYCTVLYLVQYIHYCTVLYCTNTCTLNHHRDLSYGAERTKKSSENIQPTLYHTVQYNLLYLILYDSIH